MLTCRPVFGPFPAWRAWPMIVWSTWSASTFARRRASFAASSPSSTAVVSANEPRNFPTGVSALDDDRAFHAASLPAAVAPSVLAVVDASRVRRKHTRQGGAARDGLGGARSHAVTRGRCFATHDRTAASSSAAHAGTAR